MIQLSIRHNAPVLCRSWSDAHMQIDRSFDPDGHTVFALEADGFKWEEGDMHWRIFEAIAETPDKLQVYFKFIGRA